MATEIVAEAGKMILGAVIGGLITAATALPMLNTKLTKLRDEVSTMKETCTTCRSGVTQSLQNLSLDVKHHHEDDEKHYTKASDRMLNDILSRVTRIENSLLADVRRGEA
jgi:gas vesicle protein